MPHSNTPALSSREPSQLPRELSTMSHVTHLFTVYILVTQAQSQHESGWTPISSAEVLRRLNLYIPTPSNQRMDTGWSPKIEVNRDIIHDIRDNAIKLVKPQELIGNFAVKDDETRKKTDETKLYLQNTSQKNVDLTFTEKRQAKTIRNIDNVENSIKEKQEKGKQDKRLLDTDKTTFVEDETQSYEVTEPSESADAFKSAQNFIQNSGYIYKLPEHKKEPPNFTQTFLNILDKYKIDPKDDLDNYEKSLVPKKHEPIRPQIIYLPIPANLISRFNNHNHLSVDPLIAVFLSNYGYYLPNSYGLHNNYKNLYGYLASNNIHNNKPFGHYKIFSDTDSSSK